MSFHGLSVVLSIALPALTLASSIWLLRRVIRPDQVQVLGLAASGMVFAMSALWLGNSAKALWLMLRPSTNAQEAVHTAEWLAINLAAGPYLAFSLLTLSGGFLAHSLWATRKGRVTAKPVAAKRKGSF